MKRIVRGLRLAAAAAPLLVGACNGTPWKYVKAGQVIDATTGSPIPGIRVDCVLGADTPDVAYAAGDGRFSLQIHDTCDQLAFSDVDGSANGLYLSTTLPFTETDETDMVVPLDPVP